MEVEGVEATGGLWAGGCWREDDENLSLRDGRCAIVLWQTNLLVRVEEQELMQNSYTLLIVVCSEEYWNVQPGLHPRMRTEFRASY